METHGDINLAHARREVAFGARIARHSNWRALAAVALVTMLLSLSALFSPALMDFFSPTEAALAWLKYLAELAVIAAALFAAFTMLDNSLPRTMPYRLAVVCAVLLTLSAVLAVLLHAYYAHGFQYLPPALRVLADSLRWGLPAVFLALIAQVHRRALQAYSEAYTAELANAQLEQADSEQQLALLQAQVEPHFLFNVLGNVRRLYRTQPRAGAEAVDRLIHYLHTALPQFRSRRTLLGDEIALVRAYLDLFQLRMGAQLRFSIEAPDALQDAEFPPTLLLTLVENAIKHGLEPFGGGHIEVRARCRSGMLEVTVLDDGAGFGATASSGSGVGLANIRRQLAARYQNQGRLILEEGEPRGACATLVIPLRSTRAGNRAAGDAVTA